MAITKSEYDTNDYRVVALENGVVAVLISNKHRRGRDEKRHSKTVSEETFQSGEPQQQEKGNEGEERDSLGEEEEEEEEEEDEEVEGEESEEESDGSEEMDGGDVEAKSACAVCINAGSLSDPPDIPGLAHLLEHMVFMGSERYKGENTFDSFISRHGGQANACTDYEKTIFHFTIVPKFLKKALDMFAHFFASPLLLDSSLDREIEAVDSEFQESIQSDSDRLQRLMCTTAHPDHPYTNFVWGNAESLRNLPNKGIPLTHRLREFYNRHYSSHYMTIVVLSTDSLDDLEQWTRSSFSAIPHNQLPAPNFNERPPAFTTSKFHKLYRVVPVADVNEVQLVWQLPCLFDQYRVKPMVYLSWLLGHEGKGSVLYHLKNKNLATDIAVGNATDGYEYNSCFSLFTCTLTLTDKGQEQIVECLSCIFQYLHLLRESGPQERVYREIQVVELNGFTFKEMDDPETYTMDLCEAMQFYPETDYLTGPYLLFDYKPEVIAMVTDLLVPDKVNIMWSSRQFKGQCQLTEKWFGTPHSIEEIPLEWKEAWKNPEVPPYLHLPQPNPFIATEFNIKTPTAGVPKYPEVLSEDERCRLWFRQDATFKLPRACVHVILENPLHKISPKNAVLMDMFLELLQLNMTHVVYNANMALLQYSASVENRGIAITVGGLNEKLPIFFKSIVDSFASFSTTQENFDMVKEGLHRSYRNSLLDPGDLCRSVRVKVLAFTYWSASQKDDVVDGLTIDDLNALITQFKARLFTEVLVQGNMAPEEAKDLTTYLCSQVNFDPLPPAQKFKPCAMRLPAATEVCVDVLNRDPDCPNTVITDYYQCCPRNVKDETIAYFVSHCMAEPAFDELRTKKQLGYEVYPEPHNTHEMTGLSLTVVTQSSKHSVQWVTECMQNFISGFLDTFQAWSAEEFHSHVDSLVQDRLEPDLSPEAEVERNWEQIQGGHYHFDHLLKEVGVLRKLSHHEVGSWLHRYTHVGDHYKRLRVQVLTQSLTTTDDCCDTDEKEYGGDLVTRVLLKECDIERFKDTLTTYSYSS